jgi:hypothetical protein
MRVRLAGGVMFLLAAVLITACRNPFGREYEYEEQVYLDIDGSAAIVVDSSIPALVALRGLPVEPSARSRFDPIELRQVYERAGCQVTRIGSPWYRKDRRFIEVRLAVGNVAQLQRCAPLAWSTYRFERAGELIEYQQRVGAAAGGNPGAVNWTGDELVAFKLHVPSKVIFHNVRRLEDNSPGEIERGNILTWEQRLADRRAGAPIDIQVQMEPQSILYRTLWLFAGSFLAAVVALAAIVAWTVRNGRKRIQNSEFRIKN